MWQPSASLSALRRRSELLDAVRNFLNCQGCLEVEPPLLSSAGSLEPHVESMRVEAPWGGLPEGWLITSAEFHLKRLLAADYGDVFSVSKVFRQGEVGRLHNPEFTMVEWYHVGWSHHQLMHEVGELLATLLPERSLRPYEKLSYREAFRRYTELDPFAVTTAELAQFAVDEGELPNVSMSRDDWLDLLVARKIYPQLGKGVVHLLYDFPASQASLAKIAPGNRFVAERFEAIVDGIELANGFNELTDATELRRRFKSDERRRNNESKSLPALDRRFLAAVEAGLPQCAGVALGFDRLVMLALGAEDIREVIPFPATTA